MNLPAEQKKNKKKGEERRAEGILAEILKEQIKQCQAHQAKERKGSIQFWMSIFTTENNGLL